VSRRCPEALRPGFSVTVFSSLAIAFRTSSVAVLRDVFAPTCKPVA